MLAALRIGAHMGADAALQDSCIGCLGKYLDESEV